MFSTTVTPNNTDQVNYTLDHMHRYMDSTSTEQKSFHVTKSSQDSSESKTTNSILRYIYFRSENISFFLFIQYFPCGDMENKSF